MHENLLFRSKYEVERLTRQIWLVGGVCPAQPGGLFLVIIGKKHWNYYKCVIRLGIARLNLDNRWMEILYIYYKHLRHEKTRNRESFSWICFCTGISHKHHKKRMVMLETMDERKKVFLFKKRRYSFLFSRIYFFEKVLWNFCWKFQSYSEKYYSEHLIN